MCKYHVLAFDFEDHISPVVTAYIEGINRWFLNCAQFTDTCIHGALLHVFKPCVINVFNHV